MPNLLLIGSGGRNSGKTTLACAIIEKFSRRRSVIGVKVTVIADKKGPCPRGTSDCGVCASLKGDYCITVEKDAEKDKDTSKMLKSGAEKVLWLRVMYDALDKGCRALMKKIPEDAAVVAESNRMRLAVVPGLFLMKANTASRPKRSARLVWDFADRIIRSRKFNIDKLQLTRNRWKIAQR